MPRAPMDELWEEMAKRSRALALAQESYDGLFESAPDAYLVTNKWGTILDCNRAASALLGRTARFLVGKPLAALIPLAARPEFRRNLTQLAGAARWHSGAFELSVRRSPTGLCWVIR